MHSTTIFISLIAAASAAAVLPRQAENNRLFLGVCRGKVNQISGARFDTSPTGSNPPPGSATISDGERNVFHDWSSPKPFEFNLGEKVGRFTAQLGERASSDEEPMVGEKVGSGTLKSSDGEEVKMRCVKASEGEKFEMGGMECVQMVQCAREGGEQEE